MSTVPALTVMAPVYNEAPVLRELHRRLRAVLDGLAVSGVSSLILAVDDGSTDGSAGILDALAAGDPGLTVVHMGVRLGQHDALMKVMEGVRSPMVVTIDADLQNPPEEIPRLVRALQEGWDLVATRRIWRYDPESRRIASRLANASTAFLTRLYTRVPLHDMGCMLRGYSGRLVQAMAAAAGEPGAPAPFIPALALRHARTVIELDVAHAPRGHGRSRYTWVKLLDIYGRLIRTLGRRG